MAAEHESQGAHGRGDQPAALPPAGADAGARPRRSTTSTPTSRRPSPTSRTGPCCESPCPTRVPWPSPRPRCCASRGYRERRDSRELVAGRPGQRRRVLLPAPARHRGLRRRRHARRRASPAATCCSTRAPTPTRSCRSASPARPSGSPARPGGPTSVAEVAGQRVATSYPGLVAQHLAEHGVTAEVVRLDGAVETAVQLGVADVIADVVETGIDAAGRRAGDLRRADPAVRGGPDPPPRAPSRTRRSRCWAAGCRASWSPGATC